MSDETRTVTVESAIARLLWLHDEGAKVMEGGAFVDAMDAAMERLRTAAALPVATAGPEPDRRMVEWIAAQPVGFGDWACVECKPGSDILVEGFRCMVHEARSRLRGAAAQADGGEPGLTEAWAAAEAAAPDGFLSVCRWEPGVYRTVWAAVGASPRHSVDRPTPAAALLALAARLTDPNP